MSKKPLKHSENTKKARLVATRQIEPEYHLIVTEGTKTEPNYFKGLKKEIELKFKHKLLISGHGRNTLSLLEEAEKLVYKNQNPIKHVWLVYDKDDFPKYDFDNAASRCRALSNGKITYHALWSNECIEFWFLLHYKPLTSALSRDNYYHKLSEHLNYKKNMDGIYELLKSYMPTAIKSAKDLDSTYGDLPPSRCAPGIKVYKIFEFFIKGGYLKFE